jgi:PRTRC genetic system protein B
MKNITEIFEEIYIPQKAIVIFRSLKKEEHDIYVEAYDMDERGCPINAHPLNVSECAALAEILDSSEELKREFLKPKGLLTAKMLYINPDKHGFAVWQTPAQEVNLFFAKTLGITCGKAKVPALIWKATKDNLFVYALREEKNVSEKTNLYYAPFFNIYKDGRVCMGTVDIEINHKCFLEEFIQQWEQYFWNSYFSHLIDTYSPVKINIVQLWQDQVKSGGDFPREVLIKNGKTVKDILI